MTPSKQIIEVLNYLGEKIGITIEWTAENIMPYLTELFARFIKWEISTSIVWIVLAVLMIAVAIILFTKIEWISDEIDCDFAGFVFGCAIVITILGIIVIICQTFDIVKACTIPEMTLYKYISDLMSTN